MAQRYFEQPHDSPHLRQNPLLFCGKCIDQNEMGHLLLDTLNKKKIVNELGIGLGLASDVYLLAKNLTPSYLEVVSQKWRYMRGNRFFLPFSAIIEVRDDILRIKQTKLYGNFPACIMKLDATSVINSSEPLVSLKRKLLWEDYRFGCRWRKEYEDQHLDDNPFHDAMFW